eukprot:37348_1
MFVPGDIVVIHSLKTKSEWNHKKAAVLQRVSQRNRYAVRILSYHDDNPGQTALLKPTNLTFVSKQRYTNKLEGKIISTNIAEDNDVYTQFTWSIPSKQLPNYFKLSSDCSCISPIFEFQHLLFVFELLPNGYSRADRKCLSCYSWKGDQMGIGPVDNDGYVSLILTCLSMPFNTEQVELEYSIQLNSIADTFGSRTEVFHNHKPQSIWQRIITSDILESLKTLKVTATFKSFTTYLSSRKMINCNSLLHFSCNFDATHDAAACKTHHIREITSHVFQHHGTWKWKFQLTMLHHQSKFLLFLEEFPDYLQTVNVIALIKCSQLNIGAVICHDYDRNDGHMVDYASFCTSSYDSFLKECKDKKITFEIMLNITESIDMDGNSLPIHSKSQPQHSTLKNALVIAHWIRNHAKCDRFTQDLQMIIAKYLLIHHEVIHRIMNFEKDDELKCILNAYPHAKCIGVKFLENEEAKPFMSGFSKSVQNYYLATFEDGLARSKPLLERKRVSIIIWETQTRLMPEIGDLSPMLFKTVSGTDCIQFQSTKHGDWEKMNETIACFSRHYRGGRDVKKMLKSTMNYQELKRKNERESMMERSDEEKASICSQPPRPIRYRVWNAHIIQYEYLDVTDKVNCDDYWNVVDNALEGLYLKIVFCKMLEKRD